MTSRLYRTTRPLYTAVSRAQQRLQVQHVGMHERTSQKGYCR